MDIDSRATMSPFAHHPRDERDFQLVQQMCESINSDRLKTWIAENHFVDVLAGRVAIVGGLDVGLEHASQFGKVGEKVADELVRLPLEARMRLARLVIPEAQGLGDYEFVPWQIGAVM